MEKFDKDGNLIIENEDLDNDDDLDLDLDEDTDYKSLYEAQKVRTEKEKSRFKKTANELNQLKKSQPAQQAQNPEDFSKRVQEELYFNQDPIAKAHREEISKIQKETGMNAEDSLTLYLAKNQPDLLAKRQASTWVDWTTSDITAKKSLDEMSYDELRSRSAEEGLKE